MTLWTTRPRFLLLAGALLGAVGCGISDPEVEPSVCPQTGEFGNFGCADLVIMVEPPEQPWPALVRWDVQAIPAREGTGAGATSPSEPGPGLVTLRVTRWFPPSPAPADTASFWIRGRLLEDPRPIAVGVPLPVIATDSVLHVLRFAPVGSVAPTDTIHLHLRAP